MIDRIRFDAPVGVIGRLAERALLASYLQKLIAVRSEYLKAEAERRQRRPVPVHDQQDFWRNFYRTG